MSPENIIIHATCVSINNKAVLLMGDSGSGKSDLALRLIDAGAKLVGDDYVQITRRGDMLMAEPAPNIAGLLEVRGVGVETVDYVSNISVKLAINLASRDKIERLPEEQFFSCLGHKLPLLYLHAFDDSTPAKIRLIINRTE